MNRAVQTISIFFSLMLCGPGNLEADNTTVNLVCSNDYIPPLDAYNYPPHPDSVIIGVDILSDKTLGANPHTVTIDNSDVNPAQGVQLITFETDNQGRITTPSDSNASYEKTVGTFSFTGNNFPYQTYGDVHTQFPPNINDYTFIVDSAPLTFQFATLKIVTSFKYNQWALSHSGIFSFLGQQGPYLVPSRPEKLYIQDITFNLDPKAQAPHQTFSPAPNPPPRPGPPPATPDNPTPPDPPPTPPLPPIPYVPPPAPPIPPTPPTTPPPPSPSGCGMPVAYLDHFQAGVSIMDSPVGYTPPIGREMRFCAYYHQRLTGQPTTFNYSNLGPQWTMNWITYISGGPPNNDLQATHVEPDGSQDTYGGYQETPTQGQGATYIHQGDFNDNLAQTRATLHYRQGPERFERWLSDGTIESYAQAVGTAPNRLFFLTSITDAHGNVTTLTYDQSAATNGNAVLTSVTDPTGGQLLFSYNNNNPTQVVRVTRSRDGLSAKLGYTNGQLTSLTDPQGITSSFHYTAGFIDSMTTPYGTTTFHSQDGVGFQEADMTNPLGQQERIEYQQTLDPSVYPASEAQAPSATGLLIDNANLNNTNSFYWNRRAMDEANHQGIAVDSAAFYALARVSHWANGQAGVLPYATSTKAPLENRVWYNYQGQGNPDQINLTAPGATVLVSKIARVLDDGTTQVSSYSYNAAGLVTQSIDPLGRTTNTSYAANGVDPIQVTQTNGSQQDTLETVTYNSQHEALTITDASNQTYTQSYNAQGEIVSSTDPLGETTTWAYNADGTLHGVTLPASGATTTYTYDAAKRPATVTDSEGYVLSLTYDNLDRLIRTTHPDGTSEQAIYGQVSPLDVTQTIDRQGRVTKTTYDAIREVLSRTDPLGRTTQYGWCTCGGLASITDPNGQTTRWSRDILGRVTAKTFADGSAMQYVFEKTTSRLRSQSDANGNVTTFTYNLDNTLAGTVYTPGRGVAATANVSLVYDAAYNRVTSLTDGTGTTTYAYNAVNGSVGSGRLASVSGPVAGTGSEAVRTYSYDGLGRVVGQNVDGHNSSSTSFDSLGRVTGVSNLLGSTLYQYVDATNRLSLVKLPNWQQTSYSYYGNIGDQRLKSINNYVWGMVSNTPLSQFSYTYNPVGTIATWQQQTDANPATQETLTYDAADQLIDAEKTQTSATLASNQYNYDPAGNRLAETTLSGTTAGQFNSVNQLTEVSGTPAATTVSGNTNLPLSSVTVNALPASITNSTNFTASVPLPNGTNIVSVVAQPTASAAAVTQRVKIITTGGGTPYALLYDQNGNTLQDEKGNAYQWDAENRLISITYPDGSSSQFAYDGSSRRVQIIEKNTSGTVTSTKNFIWCGSSMCEERDASNNVTKRFYGQGEQIGGVSYYYTRDHLGSVREMTDSSGNIQARYDYDPFGRTTLVQGTNLSDFQYAGYYEHQPSGLNLTLFRAYDANTGRWLSRDPIAENGGINLYGYVGNSPANAIDPLGLDAAAAAAALSNGGAALEDEEAGGWLAGGNFDPYVDATLGLTAAGVGAYAAWEYFQPSMAVADTGDDTYKPTNRDKTQDKCDKMGGEDPDPFKGKRPKNKKEKEKWKELIHRAKQKSGRGGADNVDPNDPDLF